MVTGTHPADVVIVGAGPVGLTLAVLLGRGGHHVVVLERHPHPYGLPRAVHLDRQAAHILDSAGVMGALTGKFEPMDAYEWRNGSGVTLLRLVPDAPTAGSSWPASLMIAQPDVEAALLTAASGLPTVELDRNATVEAVKHAPDGVAAHCDDGSVVGGRWLAGCDGAGSTVRASLGVALAEVEPPSDWLVVDLLPTHPTAWSPLNVQVCDPERPTTAVSGGPGRRRFEFLRLPGETLEELGRPETVWRLVAPWGFTPANAALERSARYTFRGALAERWVSGRVALAGDAAHQLPPFAGQGLCSGLRDAANLAWKLDLVLSGAAPESLIATYPAERLPQASFELALSADLGRIICVLDPAEAAARDEAMAANTTPIPIPDAPPLGPGVTRPGNDHAGHLALPASRGGTGWMLIGREQPALEAGLAAWWASIGGRTTAASELARSLDRLGAAVVLVRPDFAIFGTAADPAGATGLVAALRNALADPYAPAG